MSIHIVPMCFAFVSNQDHCSTLSSVLPCRPCSPSLAQHALRLTTLTNSSHDLDFVLYEHASSIFLHCCFSCNLNANCNALSHSLNSPDTVHVHDSAGTRSLALRALVSESRWNTASANRFLAQVLALRGLPTAYHRNLTDLCSCHCLALQWTDCSQHHPAAWIWVRLHLAYPRRSDVVSCGPPQLGLFARAFHHASLLS